MFKTSVVRVGTATFEFRIISPNGSYDDMSRFGGSIDAAV